MTSTIGTQLELFKDQYGRYPTTEEGLDSLVHKPVDPVIAKRWVQQILFVSLDPWGRPYKYRCPGRRDPETFDLYSRGPDGVESADDIYFARHGNGGTQKGRRSEVE